MAFPASINSQTTIYFTGLLCIFWKYHMWCDALSKWRNILLWNPTPWWNIQQGTRLFMAALFPCLTGNMLTRNGDVYLYLCWWIKGSLDTTGYNLHQSHSEENKVGGTKRCYWGDKDQTSERTTGRTKIYEHVVIRNTVTRVVKFLQIFLIHVLWSMWKKWSMQCSRKPLSMLDLFFHKHMISFHF